MADENPDVLKKEQEEKKIFWGRTACPFCKEIVRIVKGNPGTTYAYLEDHPPAYTSCSQTSCPGSEMSVDVTKVAWHPSS